MIDRSYLPFNLRVTIKIQGCRSGWAFSSQSILVHSVKKEIGWFFDGFDFRWEATLAFAAYVGQPKDTFVAKKEENHDHRRGEWLSPQTLSIRTNEGYRLVEVEDVLEIRLLEEGYD